MTMNHIVTRFALIAAMYIGLSDMSLAQDAEKSRIASLGGSVTEILYELGVEDRIIAVDDTSVYPPQALKDKPTVGYIRRLNAEGVLAINPDLILAEADAGPAEAVDILTAASIPFLRVPLDYSGAGILKKIEMVGKAVGKEEDAAALAAKVKADLDQTASHVKNIPQDQRKKVLFILTVRDGRLMVAGSKSHADSVIQMAGGANLMQSISGYKMVDDEALLNNPPDVILMMSRSNHSVTDEALAALPALKDSPAIKNKQIIRMDGMYLLGFGPRTAFAAADLAHQLYPGHEALKGLPKGKK